MPLLMLWQGIGAWIVRHPDCRYLFGPVSISDTYAPASRLLLSTALLETAGEPALARLVRPRRPLRSPEAGAVRREWRRLRLSEPDQLSELVASLEPDGKGMPVLLRQYLKLGGRLLAFNVDRHFSNTLDGLILVDLLRTEPQLLQRYLTAEGAKTFLSYWQEQERAKAAS
jgi:putative hemolysin